MHDRSNGPRELLLPKEHGSWSLAFEPVALGLLVAPSAGGAALAAAAAAGFFLRRPLKLGVTLPASDPRRAPARRWAAGLLLAGATLLAAAALPAGPRALWPLLLAAPAGLLFLWFDLRQAMREAEAELAGCIAFAALPAAFATLAGTPVPAALALAGLMLARSVPTVLTVRAWLRLNKGRPAGRLGPMLAAALACALVGWLAHRGLAPFVAVLASAAFFLRTGWLLSPFRPNWSARRIGMLEAVLGVVHLALLAIAFRM